MRAADHRAQMPRSHVQIAVDRRLRGVAGGRAGRRPRPARPFRRRSTTRGSTSPTRTAPYASALSAAGDRHEGDGQRRTWIPDDGRREVPRRDRRARRTIRKELAEAGKTAPEPAARAEEIAAGSSAGRRRSTPSCARSTPTARRRSPPRSARTATSARAMRRRSRPRPRTPRRTSTLRSPRSTPASARRARRSCSALLVLAGLAIAGGVWLERRTRRRLAPLVARLRSLDEHCVDGLDRGLGRARPGRPDGGGRARHRRRSTTPRATRSADAVTATSTR